MIDFEKLPITSKKVLDKLKYIKVDKGIEAIKGKPTEAGYDLYTVEDTWILPFTVKKVQLNIKLEIPEGKFGLITSRSGCSLKGIFVIPGVIDSSYRGQEAAIVTKIGLLPQKIKKGERICQMLLLDYNYLETVEVDHLSDSVRGEKGFGSSGTK